MIDGQRISKIWALNTGYGSEYLAVKIGKKVHRMPIFVVMQMVNEFNFEIEKKRKYTHLIKAIPKEGGCAEPSYNYCDCGNRLTSEDREIHHSICKECR